eukprot:gene2500-2883_t
MPDDNPAVDHENQEQIRSSFALFRRPEKYKIRDDFDLFVKKSNLYFEAVELTDKKKRRLALLFNLSEDAFSLREFGAKSGFQGEEYTNRLVDQFILGMKDRPTQNKLLQEPPESLEDAALIARRFEAANSTIQTLRAEAGSAARQNYNQNQNPGVSSGINQSRPPPTCYRCGRKDHISRFCHAEKETSTETGKQGQSPSQENRDGPKTKSKVRLSTVSPSHKKKTPLLEAKVNGVNKLGIVDTGASISLISKKEWESLMLNEEPLRPSDIVAEAANNSPIGILGKVNLLVEVNGAHEINQEFYVANEMLSEVILGLDWLVNNKVIIDTANMVMKFPDATCQPLLMFDASLKDPTVVVLSDDIEIPGRHEIIDVEMNVPVLVPGGNTDSSSQQCELNFDLESLKPDERKLMDNVLREYRDIFATNLTEIVDKLQELQDLDEDLSGVKGWIREGSRPEQKPRNGTDVLYALYNIFDSLCVENDLLSRSWEDDTGKERYQVVLPKFITPTILKEAHEQIGHMGVAKTFDFIQRRFYWPGFFISVENFCACCEICAKNKTVPRPRWPLKPIEVVSIPFYMIGVDLIGPLKTTRSGNKYILSVIDYYTKYAEAEALPNQEAETIVRALEEIFARHGMPSVKQSSTGVTPFEMLYGRDVRLPLCTEQEELLAKPTHGPAKYLEDLRKRQDDIRRIVIERLKKAQQKQKRNYDSKYSSQQSKIFHIGDTVLLKNFRARGLEEKFIGPYIIVRVQEGNYEIESLKDKKRKIVHFNSIKPFKIDHELEGIPQKADELYSSASEIDDSIFEIEDPRPLEIRREHEIENIQPYNLRCNRRPPERYGVPVLDF